jgi:hypothetical protein
MPDKISVAKQPLVARRKTMLSPFADNRLSGQNYAVDIT